MKKIISTLSMLGAATTVLAQSYSIDWFTIDGGGGTSTGGVYSVSGTLGQPDAGVMTNGNYSLIGGFWGVTAVQTPGAPLLSVERLADGSVRVFWQSPGTSFLLQEAFVLSNTVAETPWLPVALPYQTNATHIFVTEPAPQGNRFYRLRK